MLYAIVISSSSSIIVLLITGMNAVFSSKFYLYELLHKLFPSVSSILISQSINNSISNLCFPFDKVSEYDQKMLQSHNADQPMAL